MTRKRAREEKQTGAGREILVNISPIEKRVAILDNGILTDFFMERKSLEHYARAYVDSVHEHLSAIELYISKRQMRIHTSDGALSILCNIDVVPTQDWISQLVSD